ncbi:glycyl-tRNA synthetase beta chain [Stanieria cyanosphaera PCC 7437]|uniref:Glycine--tRNA ligase beta subunit n=1 Tax=Stanieria cyanosphaera (strain ATCC 29371 / PCC 7437) TaxID=111780 RepID=K9XU74_STAC7|nr:glycine--tRNA ligase subunit beta [Stanieria cyanosphaera]AFZ36150.1 glycyl-tRNA synthetase beta chain [Stanieria cyanosphaera PCC 7437]
MPNYLLEVGVEELPADFVQVAIAQWQTRIPQSLQTEFLTPEAVEVYGTPRRLAVLIKGIPAQQADREEEIKGPPASAAFKDGQPTKAAEGFARKQGVAVEDLEVRDTDKGEFVFVQKKIQGRVATEILQELSPQWITGLEGKRFMRWGDGDLRFPRPIRWLVALFDEEILPLELVNGSETIKSDRISAGHRILHPEPVTIDHASAYLESLRAAYVEADFEVRKQKITEGIKAAAQELSGVAEIYPDLLAEVVNLVEYPTAVIGTFESEFLSLPTEVITTVMVTHQRYFPVKKAEDHHNTLLPNFITISNGDPSKKEIIAEGNARVIRARLADAQFFYKADCDEHLETYLPQLETVTFQEELGTMRDKVDRIIEVANTIAEQLNVDEQQRSEIESTALLCKADLVTQMVYEFPELQGVMGEKYALVSGESPTVARGIFEHYLPRTADDIFPETLNGQVVGIADRLDTLVNIFGLGMIPSGSSDPFALRRAANAIINVTWFADLGINLNELIQQGATDFLATHPERESPATALQEFFIQRIRTLLQDEKNIDYDLVNAVLGEEDSEYTERALDDLLDVRDRALFLQEIRNNGKLDAIYETVNRSTRLAVKGDLNTQELAPKELVNPDLFESVSEQAFYDALVELLPQTQSAQADRNYQLLVDGLAKIAPTVSNFFDGETSVLVMAEDEKIKRNRLNLLGLLRNHARVLADFGAIVKS